MFHGYIMTRKVRIFRNFMRFYIAVEADNPATEPALLRWSRSARTVESRPGAQKAIDAKLAAQ